MDVVIVDANALVGDFWMESAAWKVLLHSQDDLNARVYIPESVITEVTERYRHRVTETVRSLASAERSLIDLDPPWENHREHIDPDEVAGRFRMSLEARFVGRILSTDTTDIGEWVRRAAAREAPFDDKGSGFRDAIVWRTVLDQVEAHGAHSKVVLITADGVFYDGKSDQLAARLKEDVDSVDAEADFAIYRRVEDYVTANIAKDAELHARFADHLRRDEDQIIAQITDHLLGQPVELMFAHGGGRVVDVHNMYPTTSTVGPANDDGEHRISLDVMTQLAVEFGFFYPAGDEWETSVDDEVGPTITINATWNPVTGAITDLTNEPLQLK